MRRWPLRQTAATPLLCAVAAVFAVQVYPRMVMTHALPWHWSSRTPEKYAFMTPRAVLHLAKTPLTSVG